MSDQEIQKYQHIIWPIVEDRALDIAVWLYTTHGLPFEMVKEYWNKFSTFGDWIGFVNHYPKIVNSIYWEEILKLNEKEKSQSPRMVGDSSL